MHLCKTYRAYNGFRLRMFFSVNRREFILKADKEVSKTMSCEIYAFAGSEHRCDMLLPKMKKAINKWYRGRRSCNS